MKALTLFSGIGGFDLAFQRTGIEIESMCEIDRSAQGVLRRHFPEAKLYDDVKKVGKKTHGRRSIDIIGGGFPCQDVSIAGKRAGIAGERSGLWFEFARVIDELEPQWVVGENVPGLLSSNGGEDFAVILQWLAKRGYGVAYRIFDAQYFGVAQRRRRVFFVASLGNGSSAKVLLEPESGFWNTPPIRETGNGSADTFTIRSGKEGGGKGYLGQEALAMTVGPQEQYAVQSTVGALQARDGKGIGTTIDDKIIWEMQHASEAYRETEEGLSPTLQSRMGTGGNNVPMVGVRRLMPIECEKLQGFPPLWTEYGTNDKGIEVKQADAHRYKQLGNAVAVPNVEWIARRLTCLQTQH